MNIARISIFIAFALGTVTGSGLTLLALRSRPHISGFSLHEAQSKLGRRVKLKDNALDERARIVDKGTVACIDEEDASRYLVIAWDELLPSMKNRITRIDSDAYAKIIIEE